jgi:hypothetical protein
MSFLTMSNPTPKVSARRASLTLPVGCCTYKSLLAMCVSARTYKRQNVLTGAQKGLS